MLNKNAYSKTLCVYVCVLFQSFVESKMGTQAYLVSVPVKVRFVFIKSFDS